MFRVRGLCCVARRKTFSLEGFLSNRRFSEAWGPPQFQEKRSRSEKAILGALGEFQGILGAALGIQNSILGIRNSILGMASHDLSNTKPNSRSNSQSDSRNLWEPTWNIFICPCILGAFFQELGRSPCARDFNPGRRSWSFQSLCLLGIFKSYLCLVPCKAKMTLQSNNKP